MRVLGWLAAGFSALLSFALEVPAVRAQDNASASSPAAPKASEPPAGGVRRPQVRTYSSVTVVDDPRHAPPLPTRRMQGGAAPRPQAPPPPVASEPRPTVEPKPPAFPRPAAPPSEHAAAPDPHATPARPAAPPPPRPGNRDVSELRRELSDLRHELREPHRGEKESSSTSERAKRREENDAARGAERNSRERGARARE